MTATGVDATGGLRVVSNAHGPLRHLLLFFPREVPLRGGYRAAYADLFAQLPASTHLTVLAHAEARDLLAELIERTGRGDTTTVVPADEALRFTVWAQDPFLTLTADDDRTVLLAPAHFDRHQDATSVEVVAHALGAEVRPSPLCFHGGDVLTGDTFVLIGRYCLTATLDVLDDDADAQRGADPAQRVIARFEEQLGADRQVIVVGTERPLPATRTRPIRVGDREVVEILPGGSRSPHPLIHLDMFLTLAGRGPDGRYRILVGSPTMADVLLGRDPVDPVLSASLDDVAEQLLDEGFEVVRNPLPLTRGDGKREVDGEIRDVRLWYLASANNCLVQIDADAGDHVWLPTYGHGGWPELAAIDADNRRTWQELGFTVHELPSFHAFAQRFGALHCVSKELDRRPFA